MTTLSEFLLARIAEDDAVARAAAGSPHAPAPRWVAGESNNDGIRRADGIPVTGHSWPYEMEHIARHDPARVLAECETKRRIVEAWQHADEGAGGFPGTDAGIEMGLYQAVELLALPYADHPDYRQEWAA